MDDTHFVIFIATNVQKQNFDIPKSKIPENVSKFEETFQKSRKIKMSQEEAGNEVHLGLPCGRPKTQNSGKNSNFGRISTLLRDQVVLYKKAWVNNSTFSL